MSDNGLLETQTPAPAGGGEHAPVPYERFAAVAAERKAMKGELESLRERVAGLDAATAEAAAAKSALAAAQADYADRLAMHRHGIGDDEGQDVARMLYSRLPQENRPPLSDWLTAIKADGAAAPRALLPYFGQVAPPPAPAAAAPKPASTSGQPPPASGRADDAAIRAAREHARRTGDWTQLKGLVGWKD